MASIRDRRHANWFWMNKDIIDDYGKQIGVHGIAIYTLLSRCANENGQAIPSLRFIAERLAIGTTTVKRHLLHLETVGLIARHRRESKEGDFTSTEYTLLTVNEIADQPVAVADQPVAVADQPVAVADQPVAVADQQVYPQRSNGVAVAVHEQEPLNKNHSNKKEIPSVPIGTSSQPAQGKRNISADYTPGFLAAWACYPADRRRSKLLCFTKWCQRDLEPRAEEICTKLRRLMATQWQGGEYKFIPLIETWLNKGRYEDDLSPDLQETRDDANRRIIERLAQEGVLHDDEGNAPAWGRARQVGSSVPHDAGRGYEGTLLSSPQHRLF